MNSSSKISAIALAAIIFTGLSMANAYAFLLDVNYNTGTTEDGRKTLTLLFAEPPKGEEPINVEDVVDAVVEEVENSNDGIDEVNATVGIGEEPVVIVDDITNDTSVIVPVVTEDNITVIGTNETTGDVEVISNETTIDEVIEVIGSEETGNETAVVEEEPEIISPQPEETGDGGNVTVVEPEVEAPEVIEDNNGGNVSVIDDTGIPEPISNSTSGEIPVVVESGDNGTSVEVGDTTGVEGETELQCVTGTFDLEQGPTGVVQCLAL